MTAKTKTAMVPVAPSAQSLAEFNPRDPQTLLATAKQLAQFVTDNNLASTIQGRSYVQCEGWQFLFAVAGLDVICAKPVRLEYSRPEGEICYEAEARLFDQEGREVGYGFALCSDAERLKKGWAEYAIASMAQTRAIGKAGRNRFAFVMKAAGFEPTPAEEMSDVGTEATVVESPKKPAAAASAPASTFPVPSVGAGPSRAEESALILDSAAQIAATTSLLELKKLWDSPAIKPYKKELEHEKNTAKLRLEKQAAKPVGPVITEPATRPASTPEGLVITYATGEQKQQVIHLLNHPAIDRPTKTTGLLAMNRWSEDLAAAKLAYYQHLVDEQEQTPIRERIARDLRAWVREEVYQRRLHAGQGERLQALCNDAAVSAVELQEEWMKACADFPVPAA